MNLDEAQEILRHTPTAVASLLAGVGEPWLTANEGPDTFSPRDVVGHLIHGEETDWMPRIQRILEHGTAKAFDPFDRFGFRAHGAAPIAELLTRFAELRRENLRALAALHLTPAHLEKRGLHPALGEVTLGQLVATWAVHDLNHVGQIVRVMARRWDAEVGPWKAYLGILNR